MFVREEFSRIFNILDERRDAKNRVLVLRRRAFGLGVLGKTMNRRY